MAEINHTFDRIPLSIHGRYFNINRLIERQHELYPPWDPFKQKKHLRIIRKCFLTWCRGTESNCRHGDFQSV